MLHDIGESADGPSRPGKVMRRCAAVASLFFTCASLGCAWPDSSDTAVLASRTVGPEDLHTVGTSERIARVADLMPMDDGSVWVLNDTDPFLVRLSSDGAEIQTQGARGQGPGEFSWPSTLVRDPRSGDVWVFDTSLGKLVRVDHGAGPPETLELPRGPSGFVRLNSHEWLWMNNGGRVWLRASDDGLVFATAPFVTPWILSFWSTEVVRLRWDGHSEPILSTAAVVGDPSARFPGARRFLPFPLWAACPDGALAAYDPNQNRVHRFTPSGDSIASHALPPERRVVINTDRVFDTVYPGVLRNRLCGDPPERAELYAMVKRDYERRVDEFSAVFPEYVDIDCTADGTLWLQLFDTTSGEMGRGPVWLRITEDGARGEVHFPGGFRPMRFYRGRIWGIKRGEYDVDYVAWVEIPER